MTGVVTGALGVPPSSVKVTSIGQPFQLGPAGLTRVWGLHPSYLILNPESHVRDGESEAGQK